MRVRCGGRSYAQVNDGKSGYLSQSCLPLYFGLGDGGGAGDAHGAIGNGQDLNTLLGKMLRIDVDSSVMPTIPLAMTHLSTIAIAERAAEWI